MRILQSNDPSAIPEAVSALRQGFLIIYPTDTTYAIGADSQHEAALRAVQELKRRTVPKPLPLIASDLAQVEKLASLTPPERQLAQQYWPGPLTLLLQPIGFIPGLIVCGSPRVGIRVPNSPVARTIAAQLGRPIVATSANITGAGALYDIAPIIKTLAGSPNEPVVGIDGGTLPRTPPSTIVEVVDGRINTRRDGAIIVQLPSVRPSADASQSDSAV